MPVDAGKAAEYLFTAEALKRDLVPCWPSTAMYPFDLVVACASRVSRVQVKASEKSGKAIKVSAQKQLKGKATRYTSDDVDHVAVYLFSQDLWYIIPIKHIKGMSIYLRPEDPKCPYGRYKEAWSLLE
jgi:hypothetical protein